MLTYTYPYPLLAHVADLYQENGLRRDLSDTLLLACQHLLEPQLRMFEILLELGLPPENCVVVGKGYSTCAEIQTEIEGLGCIVAPFSGTFDPLQPFDDWFGSQLDAFLAERFAPDDVRRFRKVIVLDDGGFMHLAAAKRFPWTENVTGIEQTSSGSHRVKAAGLPFSGKDIARSAAKQQREAPHIGQLCVRRTLEATVRRGRVSPRILVCGLGTIGRNIAGTLALVEGMNTYATDINIGKVANHGAVQLLGQRGRLVPFAELPERLAEFDVVIGASGSTVVDGAALERLHPNALLLSVSSSDREFWPLPFRYSWTRIHDDCFCGGRLLANAGFPITFYGNRLEAPAAAIELTVGMLLAAVLHECSDSPPPFETAVGQMIGMWSPDEAKS